MKQQVSLSELRKIYPDEWVLIGNPGEADGDAIPILHPQNPLQ